MAAFIDNILRISPNFSGTCVSTGDETNLLSSDECFVTSKHKNVIDVMITSKDNVDDIIDDGHFLILDVIKYHRKQRSYHNKQYVTV